LVADCAAACRGASTQPAIRLTFTALNMPLPQIGRNDGTTFSSVTLTETTTAINPNFAAEAVVVTVAEARQKSRKTK